MTLIKVSEKVIGGLVTVSGGYLMLSRARKTDEIYYVIDVQAVLPIINSVHANS